MSNEWDRLKARYCSKKNYEERKVIFSDLDFEDFKSFLVNSGAEIMLHNKQSESLRFRLKGELGIVYTKGSGNLLAHNMGYKYDLMNNASMATKDVSYPRKWSLI